MSSTFSDNFYEDIISPNTTCIEDNTSCDKSSSCFEEKCSQNDEISETCSISSFKNDICSLTKIEPAFDGIDGIPGLPGQPCDDCSDIIYVNSKTGSDCDYEIGDINKPVKTVKKAMEISHDIFIMSGFYPVFKYCNFDCFSDFSFKGNGCKSILEGFEVEGKIGFKFDSLRIGYYKLDGLKSDLYFKNVQHIGGKDNFLDGSSKITYVESTFNEEKQFIIAGGKHTITLNYCVSKAKKPLFIVEKDAHVIFNIKESKFCSPIYKNCGGKVEENNDESCNSSTYSSRSTSRCTSPDVDCHPILVNNIPEPVIPATLPPVYSYNGRSIEEILGPSPLAGLIPPRSRNPSPKPVERPVSFKVLNDSDCNEACKLIAKSNKPVTPNSVVEVDCCINKFYIIEPNIKHLVVNTHNKRHIHNNFAVVLPSENILDGHTLTVRVLCGHPVLVYLPEESEMSFYNRKSKSMVANAKNSLTLVYMANEKAWERAK